MYMDKLLRGEDSLEKGNYHWEIHLIIHERGLQSTQVGHEFIIIKKQDSREYKKNNISQKRIKLRFYVLA